ncbi:type II toxin-antitoxin system VapC family toxin [Nonomuraea sp. NBC_01738]|uniref:type II toxin-antitoxin system VapC family toxin n=1 Tax=Nonomuraea sp. NBC_01738 TaxID=2976003 RepID=UPI002E166428|nr:type II toxin-antitoxin system VapC family toxin [Nonomuraea sp. NBC_01738]
MIVDSSAIIAIITAEPNAFLFANALAASHAPRMSAANWLEASIVADGRADPVVRREYDELIAQAEITVEAVTAEQARIAREAYRDFGRGSGHPAKLNFGDCFAYALAKVTGEPLLFKGEDFPHTDVKSVL